MHPSSKFSARLAFTNHTITGLDIISPIEGSTHNDIVNIEWDEASDSEGHEIKYIVEFSRQEPQHDIWVLIAQVENGTSYSWDLARMLDGILYIRVTAVCSSNHTSEDMIQIRVRHLTPPLFRFIAILSVLVIIISILFLPQFLKKKMQKSQLLSLNSKKKDQFPLGIAIGLFDEYKGFKVIHKNDILSSMYDDSEILSMVVYSARIYEQDRLNTPYGPFPILNREDLNKEWMFEVFWTKLIDKSSVDPRIIRNSSKIPMVILFIYNQELQQIFEKKRKDIMIALRSATELLKDVESLNKESFIMIQNKIIDLL
jgi:hypothetical protein